MPTESTEREERADLRESTEEEERAAQPGGPRPVPPGTAAPHHATAQGPRQLCQAPRLMSDDLTRLLRAMASGTQAQENKHDIILHAAADEIDKLRSAFVLFLAAQNEIDKLRNALAEAITIIHDCAAMPVNTDHLDRILDRHRG